MLLGTTMIFFAALLAAEHHDLGALRNALGTADPFAELEAMTRIGVGFNRALLASEIAVVLGALTLLWRRSSLWAVSALLALACLATSAHAFACARSELRQMVENAQWLDSASTRS
jgi:hypothetical protein